MALSVRASVHIALFTVCIYYVGLCNALQSRAQALVTVPSIPDGHWIDTWVSMPQLTEPANLPPAPYVRSSSNFGAGGALRELRSNIERHRRHLQKQHGPPNGAPLNRGIADPASYLECLRPDGFVHHGRDGGSPV